jgi:hypothetical protein
MNLYEARLIQLRIKEANTREEIENIIQEAYTDKPLTTHTLKVDVTATPELPQESIDYAVNRPVETEDKKILEEVSKELETKKSNRRTKNG